MAQHSRKLAAVDAFLTGYQMTSYPRKTQGADCRDTSFSCGVGYWLFICLLSGQNPDRFYHYSLHSNYMSFALLLVYLCLFLLFSLSVFWRVSFPQFPMPCLVVVIIMTLPQLQRVVASADLFLSFLTAVFLSFRFSTSFFLFFISLVRLFSFFCGKLYCFYCPHLFLSFFVFLFFEWGTVGDKVLQSNY